MDGHQRLFTGQDLPKLRKPKKDVDDDEDDGNNEIVNNVEENILLKSTLSVDAKEFVPRNCYVPNNNTLPVTKSVQSRLARNVNMVANNDEEQLQQQQQHQILAPSPVVVDQQYIAYGAQELEHLREVVMLLTVNPGRFDDTVPIIRENLKMYLNDKIMMDHVVMCIVEQAIEQHNFGYSGARLCVVLDSCFPLLKACLIQYCDSIQFNVNKDPIKPRNYTLFLGELFSQLDWDETFGRLLLGMIQQLLGLGEFDDIKCICQVLKLTGAALESLNYEAMEDIISRLKEKLHELPTPYTNLLENVLKLREIQWGRTTTHHTPSSLPLQAPHSDYPPESPALQRWSDGGPVFYGPDGLELSAEESEFLTDVADELAHDDSDPDALWDPEMDEEIKTAYKEFVSMNNK